MVIQQRAFQTFRSVALVWFLSWLGSAMANEIELES